jgi:hypothetical protein
MHPDLTLAGTQALLGANNFCGHTKPRYNYKPVMNAGKQF